MNLTRTLPEAKFILKSIVICSLCMFFVKSGEMLFMKRIFCNWFEISKMWGSCNIINVKKLAKDMTTCDFLYMFEMMLG